MKLIDIKKTYHNHNNNVEALKGISLDLEENGIIMILGPSGCGKSTLLDIIAGKLSYEGIIEDVPDFDYLTQEFNLMEELTVWDNLFLVSHKRKRIEKYLSEFDLLDQKDKKVKKLSNGQKRRVQFIRALLHKPGLLLCDEPTAALDHENTRLLMEELKKISDGIQILMVTHDTALAEKYADGIITMEQGVIVHDQLLNHRSKAEKGETMRKRDAKKGTFHLVLKELASRPFDSILSVFLMILSILTVFTIGNLYTNIHAQSDYASMFRNGENMIVSVPHQSERIEGKSLDGYTVKYTGLSLDDLFDYSEIQTLIDEMPEIIAVESWNSAQYAQDSELDYARRSYDSLAWQPFSFEQFTSADGTPLIQSDYPANDPVLVNKNYQAPVREELNQQLADDDVSYMQNYVQPFDIVNGYDELPLLCGSYPQGDAVLLSRNAADLLMQIDGYTSYEEMIGQPMRLALRGYKNYYSDAVDDVTYFDTIDVTISGVSGIENNFTTMIFFHEGFGNNPVWSHFSLDQNAAKLYYVRFLLKPGCDYDDIASRINSFFHKENTDITLFHGKGLGKDQEFYESPSGFMIYAVVILTVIFALILVSDLFKRKRMRKEKNILSVYGYSIVLETLQRNALTAICGFILSLLISGFLCRAVNAYASAHYYQPFMNENTIMLAITSAAVGFVLILLELITGAGGKHAQN